MLQVFNLCKKYGDLVAIHEVSFHVKTGQIVGLLGPNGAGKTTTINIILGILEPDEGRVLIAGIDLSKDRSRALSKANFSAVYAPLPGNMTVFENLGIFARLYGVKKARQRVEKVLHEFKIESFKDKKCGVLSSGEQTRVCLAKAVINHPKLLLLDEPTASLDPATAREIRAQMRSVAMNEGMGVLWTSHNMHEVEAVCDHVLFLSHGKILLEGDPKILPAQYKKKSLEDLFVSVACEPLTLKEG